MVTYDFTPKTFSEFLKINNLSIQDGIFAITNEYVKLKERKGNGIQRE